MKVEAEAVGAPGRGSNAKTAVAVEAATEIHGTTVDLVEMVDASAAAMMTAVGAVVVVDVTSTLMAGSDLLPPTKTQFFKSGSSRWEPFFVPPMGHPIVTGPASAFAHSRIRAAADTTASPAASASPIVFIRENEILRVLDA